MDKDYKNGFIDGFGHGFGVGFIKGTDEGFTMGKGQQAKETRDKLGTIFSEGLQYMKGLKKTEARGEIVAKFNEEKRDTLLQHVKIKDKL